MKLFGNSYLLLKWCVTAITCIVALAILWLFVDDEYPVISTLAGFAISVVGGCILALEFSRSTTSLRSRLPPLNRTAAVLAGLTAILSVVWIHSLNATDHFAYNDGSHTYRRLVSLGGVVCLSVVQFPASKDADQARSWLLTGWRHQRMPEYPGIVSWKYLGFRYSRGPSFQMLMDPSSGAVLSFIVDETEAMIPYWFPMLCTACYPLWALIRIIRSRRRCMHHLCPTCSYDLRAHAAGQKCPECGTIIPAKNVTMAASKRSTT